jgi:hypothetical protein
LEFKGIEKWIKKHPATRSFDLIQAVQEVRVGDGAIEPVDIRLKAHFDRLQEATICSAAIRSPSLGVPWKVRLPLALRRSLCR